ncbi:MAG: transcriptional repressor [Phycisphaeraceae bacterium]|nr:transcriptional repressor [Phycisphaerales bacterium]MCB9859509.1 transcriptional repressor [Phycisphaeraceae bacterium]
MSTTQNPTPAKAAQKLGSKPSDIGSDAIEIVEPLCSVFRRHLKADGQKYTPERAIVLDAIMRIEGVFEADDLVEFVRQADNRVSKATVYRTLRLLQDAGIVQRVLIGGDQPRYQLVYGTQPRDYLIRLDTGEAEPINIPELAAIRKRICDERGLEPKGYNFTIFAVKK